jgi:hypothetical protein
MQKGATPMYTNESPETTKFVRTALDILNQDGPMTFRQLFWRLVSAGAVHNDVETYERANRIVTRLIEDGRCPDVWIVDRSRPPLTIEGNPRDSAQGKRSPHQDYAREREPIKKQSHE